MLADSDLELRTYAQYRDPVEGSESYIDNALLKARALREQLDVAGIGDVAVLADDSGIELDALDGGPGVDSAYYAGVEASWDVRLSTMLDAVRAVADDRRGARFICIMALILPDDREIVIEGEVRGLVAAERRGTRGFGYDPIFFYPPIGKTFGEIPEAEKNALSHRGNASRALLAALGAEVL